MWLSRIAAAITRGVRPSLSGRARDPSSPLSPYYLRQDPRGAHMRLLALIPPAIDVLDVGCASGYLARLLIERNCRVVGVEIDPDAARRARAYCQEVYELSAETLDRLPADCGPFQVILFGDVLEHLAHPDKALSAARRLLQPDGTVVLSVPNIAHFSIRLHLLMGRFNYTAAGLLDRTHLHFFTRQSIAELARSCGFRVVARDVTQGSPLIYGGHLLRKLGLERGELTHTIDAWDLWLSRRMPGLFGFQHLLVLRPAPDDIPARVSHAVADATSRGAPPPVPTP